jgi:phosphate starvation-inducible PhoH-like protein
MNPVTATQKFYITMLRSNLRPIVIATGPAGTGKTMLACQAAAEKLYNNSVKKIIITRPVVTTDESLGYLPGDIEHKMDPYMRPIYDVFENSFTRSRVKQFIANETIEISPLAYMRGRTFKDAYIIGDEMQNTTVGQMKMFMTRLGDGSKMVITGDMDQCDLPDKTSSGLLDLTTKLSHSTTPHVSHVVFENSDIQRHRAIEDVLKLYI